MAAPTQTTKVIQLVGRSGDSNNVFNHQGMKQLITSCDARKDHYIVVSIIGAQSSGKSTLMNRMFNTKFDVMDESKVRGRTTLGIRASICMNPRAVVLDVEGTDGAENKNDLGFENRSALFSFIISDVIFVNMWIHTVNLAHWIPLLTKVFQEIQKRAGTEGLPEGYKTLIVFAVRDYNGKTPEGILKTTIISNVKEIWRTIPQKENSKFERYFKLHVELFPDFVHQEDKFNNKCKEISRCIADGYWVDGRPSDLPVCNFPSYGKDLWEKIVENKTLNIPSQMEMMARTSCDTIMDEKFAHFESKKYLELTNPPCEHPRQYEDKLSEILDQMISDYNNETRVYGKHADQKKDTLRRKIVLYAEPEFARLMKKFQTTLLQDTENKIKFVCGKHTSKMDNRTNSVVNQYYDEYLNKTKGLKFYGHLEDSENFPARLRLVGEKLAAEIKKKNIKELILRVATGVLTGVASAASALAAVCPLAGPWALLVGTISGVVAAISGGTAALTAKALAQSEMDDISGPAVQEGHKIGKEYLSSIMENAASAARQVQFETDATGDAIEAGNKLGKQILSSIMEAKAPGEVGGTSTVLGQSLKDSSGSAVDAGHKLGQIFLSRIMEAKEPWVAAGNERVLAQYEDTSEGAEEAAHELGKKIFNERYGTSFGTTDHAERSMQS